MKLEDYSNRIEDFQQKLYELVPTDVLTIRDILAIKPSRFDVKGVYAISTPEDSEIVYVGKTLTKSVIGRVADHKSIDTKSDLKGMLKLFPDCPQEIDKYLVRCMRWSPNFGQVVKSGFCS